MKVEFKKWFLFLVVAMMILAISPVKAIHAAGELPLTESLVESSSDKYDARWGKWKDGKVFETTDGQVIDGVGLNPYYGGHHTFVSLNIKDYEYTTLETLLSIDKNWSVGDFGKTEFVVYADDQKIFTKTFTNTTKAYNLKVAVPKGTESLTFYAVMQKGSKGEHYAIFGNPKLTNELPSKAKVDKLSLVGIDTASVSDNYDYQTDGWRNTGPFELADGSMVPVAVGLYPYYSGPRTFASFIVKDYNYSTLEARLSIDNKWRKGDLGKSEFVIYADNQKVYTKTLTNTTPIQNIKVRIPKNTKEIYFYGLHEDGSQGMHRLILEDPKLTNSLAALPGDDSVALTNIGVSSQSDRYDVNDGKWRNDGPLQMAEGYLVSRGFGLDPYYGGTETFASFFVGDYKQLTSLETKISLDNKWRTGDRGKSVVYIYADKTLLGNYTLTNSSKTVNVVASIPSNAKYITFKVKHIKGKRGLNHRVIIDNPLLTSRPGKPVVNKILTSSKAITGKAKAGTTVSVKIGTGKKLYTARTDSKGNYKVTIPAQKLNTVITVTATDTLKRVSAATVVKVLSK